MPDTVRRILWRSDLDDLFLALRDDSRRIIGPTFRDGAVVLDPISSSAELPVGVSDVQEAGTYRAVRDPSDPAVFRWVVGPDSAKRWLHPTRVALWRAERREEGVTFTGPRAPSPLALIGLRACDLAAVRIQDRVLVDGVVPDTHYATRRRDLFVVAV